MIENSVTSIQLLHDQEARPDTIVNIVRVVMRGRQHDAQLRLQTRLQPIDEASAHTARLQLFQPLGIGSQAVLQHAFADLERQLQPIEVQIPLLQQTDHAQALEMVLKATTDGHAGIQCVLACMVKRVVAEVGDQRNRLD